MLKYAGKQLKRGKQVIHVLFYIAPSTEDRKSPCGTRRGKYACLDSSEYRYIMTHNISRYVRTKGYVLLDEEEEEAGSLKKCYLHAQYCVKNQENVTEKTEGLWNKFLNLFR